MVKKARKSGVRWLAVGIESANPNTRKRLNKGKFTNTQVMDAVRICEDNDIQIIANYMVGLDGETAADYECTLSFAKLLNTAFMNVYSYVDYAGKLTNPRSGKFRNMFFKEYFNNREYLKKINKLFGNKGIKTINKMLEVA